MLIHTKKFSHNCVMSSVMVPDLLLCRVTMNKATPIKENIYLSINFQVERLDHDHQNRKHTEIMLEQPLRVLHSNSQAVCVGGTGGGGLKNQSDIPHPKKGLRNSSPKVPLICDQTFQHRSLWGPFSSQPPYSTPCSLFLRAGNV